MTTYQHDDVRDLLGAYALDALDATEREVVDGHLETCARCAAELADHLEVASALAYSGGDAPPELWDRIATEIRAAPNELPVLPRPAPAASSTRFRRWAAPLLAAAAVIAAVAFGAQALQQADRIDQLEQQAQPTVRDLAQRALTMPGARTARLAGSGDLEIVAVVGADGTGYLFGAELAPLSEDLTYQLWGIREGVAISLGVLGPRPDVVTFSLSSDADLLAVTAEQRGGVITSTQAPVVAGNLS